MPWFQPEESRVLPINGLAANILCTRHNSALSPLDTEAGRFFRAAVAIDKDLAVSTRLSGRGNMHLFSGPTLEMWMVKVACGIFYSRIGRDGGERLIDEHEFDERLAVDALAQGRFEKGAGMYVRGGLGQILTADHSLSVGPILHSDEKRVVGALLVLRGRQFVVLFDPKRASTFSEESWMYRPSELVASNDRRAHIIRLTWPRDVPFKTFKVVQAI